MLDLFLVFDVTTESGPSIASIKLLLRVNYETEIIRVNKIQALLSIFACTVSVLLEPSCFTASHHLLCYSKTFSRKMRINRYRAISDERVHIGK